MSAERDLNQSRFLNEDSIYSNNNTNHVENFTNRANFTQNHTSKDFVNSERRLASVTENGSLKYLHIHQKNNTFDKLNLPTIPGNTRTSNGSRTTRDEGKASSHVQIKSNFHEYICNTLLS